MANMHGYVLWLMQASEQIASLLNSQISAVYLGQISFYCLTNLPIYTKILMRSYTACSLA